MDGDGSLEWRRDVEQAAWIAELLSPFDSGVLTSVVPPGFEAYARLLHPVEGPEHGDRLVRWAEVAAWSGVPLVPGGQFHEIALPEHESEAPAPWRSQGPREGTLKADDVAALVDMLAGHTRTPERCWFCLSAGLIDRLVAEPRVEAQPASPGDRHHQRVTGWLGQAIDRAVAELMDSGKTTVETSRGTVRADLQRPSRWRRGCLHADHEGRNGVTGGSTWMLDDREDDRLRSEVSHYLTGAIIGLVGG